MSKASVYNRKYRYGISEEQYNALLSEQDNKCAVCLAEFTSTKKPNVDHDRNCCPGTKSCGQCLRGLLCSRCVDMASVVETRFKYMNNMLVYLHEHLIKLAETRNRGGE